MKLSKKQKEVIKDMRKEWVIAGHSIGGFGECVVLLNPTKDGRHKSLASPTFNVLLKLKLISVIEINNGVRKYWLSQLGKTIDL